MWPAGGWYGSLTHIGRMNREGRMEFPVHIRRADGVVQAFCLRGNGGRLLFLDCKVYEEEDEMCSLLTTDRSWNGEKGQVCIWRVRIEVLVPQPKMRRYNRRQPVSKSMGYTVVI